MPIYTESRDTEIIFVEDFKQYALSKMGLLKLIEPYQFIKLKQELQEANCLQDLAKINVTKLMNTLR